VTNVVISSAARTAIGSYGKSLASVPPSDLGATASTAALERAGVEPEQVDNVVFGNVIHTEPGDAYMARVVGTTAGVPKEVPAYTINRLCGTGVQGDRVRGAGDPDRRGDCRADRRRRVDEPWPVLDAERALGRADGRDDPRRSVMGALTDPFNDILMGVTAENLAERGGISRERRDAFAVESHRRAARARAEGVFDD
jgi:acetyl-CoA C-acetyltransferase